MLYLEYVMMILQMDNAAQQPLIKLVKKNVVVEILTKHLGLAIDVLVKEKVFIIFCSSPCCLFSTPLCIFMN